MNKRLKKNGYLISGSTGHVGSHFLNRIQGRQDLFVRTVGRTLASDILWENLSLADFRQIDVVYHLAGTTDLWSIRNDKTTHNFGNVKITEKIFSLFLDSDATLFVYMSTAKVMGEGRSDSYRINEIPRPETVYSMSKWEAEQRLSVIWMEFFKLNPDTAKRFVILRPTMIYGADIRGSLYLLLRWVKIGMPILSNWLTTSRSMLNIQNVSDVLESIPSQSLLLPIYFLADLPNRRLSEIINLISVKHNQSVRIISLKIWHRKLLFLVDKWILNGRLSWQMRRLESNFLVDDKGVWGYGRSERMRLSEKRLREYLGSLG